MRPEMIEPPTPYSMSQESPKASSVWSTERRLLERQPPSAPRKSERRISSSSSLTNTMREQQNIYEASTKKQRNDRLLLPSRTINEDDESPDIAFSYRRTNLTSVFNRVAGEIGVDLLEKDPTTVLLIPESSPLPWYNNEYDDNDDDDMILSPRLFRFGPKQHTNLSCFASIDLADEDDTTLNNKIFRDMNSDIDADEDDEDNNGAESRDLFSSGDEIIQRRYTWANHNISGFPIEATTSDDDDRN